ncbi:MAG TPA: RNA-binding protein [Nitrospirota bacterium]|nr:RNA-binding protein [Nitrospirota bacterium]
MATKIRVENLPCDITEDVLENVFSQVGSVESVRIQPELLSFSAKKCFGYVEMSLDVDAYRAVHCFNNATLHNRKIHIIEDKPLYERAKNVVLQQMHVLARQAEDIKQQYVRKFH